MSDEPIMSNVEMQHLLGVKHKMQPVPPKQSGSLGVGIWLVSWGIIFFAFERYVGLTGWPMWACRIAGLALLLMGTMGIGLGIEGQKEQ
jgi:hypothetical protein